MKDFKFSPSSVQHIYQRAIDKGVIFYTLEDRMVYYTLAAVKAKRHSIRVVAASIMFTHMHQSVIAPSSETLRSYLHDTDTSFTRLYNFRYKRHGRLFEKPPGRSQKRSPKEQRANLAYVYNNHVEKKICRRATGERWSLLAYSDTENPFSKADAKTCSSSLMKAMRLVNRRVKKNTPLEYVDLDRIRHAMSHDEYECFIDYAISRYGWIDYSFGDNLFGSHDKMLTALDSMAGSEYEIREVYTNKPDTVYNELVYTLSKLNLLSEIYAVTTEKRTDLMLFALKIPGISPSQVEAFFHGKIIFCSNGKQSTHR